VLLACSLPILQLIVDQAGGVRCANKLRCSQYAYCGTGCQSQSSYAAPKGVLPGRILFNYLGSNRVDIVYNDIPVTRNDFVWVLGLSFAIDMNLSGVPQNGIHSVSWNPNLTKAAAKSWRATHSNGRIVISIGGSQLYTNNAVYDVNWHDPPNPTQWLANAFSSITIIVQDYSVDGIDIGIERFPNGACILVSHRAPDHHSEEQ
jgi:hypothetical protein